MPRYRLTIAYDGTDFCGWQKQFPHADAVPGAPLLESETQDPSLSSLSPLPSSLPPVPPTGPPVGAPPSSLFPSPSSLPPVPPDVRFGQPVPSIQSPPTLDRTDSPLPTNETNPDRPRVELRTVQGVVERAVRYVVREPVQVSGASRTDSGVHAQGQVAAFTCTDSGGREGGWPVARGTEPLLRAINARLPRDVLVTAADIVPQDFDPIRHATRKAYSYTLWTGPDRPLWERGRALHIWRRLDVPAMHAAAQVLVGEHDFAGFAAAGHGRKTTIRTVYACTVRRASPEKIIIEIVGSGFLWNMVRIIAGTLVEVGKGAMDAAAVQEALSTGDRRLAGATAPAHGLCLEWIQYATTAA